MRACVCFSCPPRFACVRGESREMEGERVPKKEVIHAHRRALFFRLCSTTTRKSIVRMQSLSSFLSLCPTAALTMKRSHVVPVILLSKSVVGASTVAFPRFFAALGWPLALAMLLALSAATVTSTEVVLGAMHESRSGSYAGAVKATLEGGGGSEEEEEEEEEEGGDDGRRGGRGRRSGGLFLSLRRSLPSVALEASGTAFSFGLLCVYNIVVADLAVGGERGSGNGGGSSGSGGGLLCPFPLLGGKGKELFCSRPRFSLLLNALVLVPLSLRPAARDSKVPSAIGIASLLAWTTATMALCFCAWLGGTLSAPSAVPDWAEIAADSGGGEGGRGGGSGGRSLGSLSWRGSGASASASAAAAAGAPPPPPPAPLPPLPPPPPSLLACLVGLARAAGLPTSGLVCQLTAPFIVGEVNRRSPREAALIVREAGVLSAAVYALLGIGAGALFGSGEVEANVLSNWRPEALAAAVPWLFGGGGRSGGGGEGGGEGGIRGQPSPPLAAARLLSALVRGAVAASLITMYPLLMFPCRDGALRLWGRLFWKEEEEKESEEEEAEAEQRLLSEEEGREGEGDEDDDDEGGAGRRRTAAAPAASAAAAAPAASTSHSSSSSSFSHAASTLLLASAAALAALSSGDSAFDVLRLTGATAGAVVSYILPAALALASGRRRRGAVVLAAALAAVGAVMIGTAF